MTSIFAAQAMKSYNIIFFLLLVAWICKNNSQSPWHNFLLATTLAQIFYIVRESSFTPYLPFGLAAIFLTSKIPYFLFPKALPNLSMKEGSLFCSYEIQRTRMLQIVFLVSRESSRRGGVHGLGSMTFGLAVEKFLNIEWFLHWKLNYIVAEIFGGIGMCLWCCWKDLDE